MALAAFTVLLLGAVSIPASAASRQVSDGLPFSDINLSTTLPQISPNGLYAVYRQDADQDSAIELWSVLLSVPNANPVRLSDVLVSTPGQFMTFAISPDSSRVVYLVDQDTPGKLELYSTPITGGASSRLNPSNMASNRDVLRFVISPDSNRVYYNADIFTATKYELFGVDITGGTSIKLNADLATDNNVEDVLVSPNSQTVVYLAGRSGNRYDLFSVDSERNTEPGRISTNMTSAGAVDSYFRISPNGQRVVYIADALVDETYDLYSVPIQGGASAKLNGTMPAQAAVDPGFLISPDSSRVVFRADQTTVFVYNLYSVPIAGTSAATKLNGNLTGSKDVELGFAISSVGNKVVYRSDEDINDLIELYSVPLAGGSAPVPLNAELTSGGDVLDLAITPNGSRVIYRADQNVDTLNELFSVPISGGTVTRLNRTLASGGDVQTFLISNDSAWVIYGADQDADTLDELLAVPAAGGTVEDLNSPLVSGGDVKFLVGQTPAFAISDATSRDIIYAADEGFDEQVELYVSNLGGPPSPPTSVVATPGNTQVSVSFVAPANNGGSPITGYAVTPSPATVGWVDTQAGTLALTHLVTGLTNGVAYTFTVRATNVSGTGDPSVPSNSATPATAPSAPLGPAAIGRHKSADVTFSAPASNGGSPVTGYTVTPNPASIGWVDAHAGSTALTHRVTGLTNGTPYTFTVVANNAVGQSVSSAPTSAVTPGCGAEVGTNVFCDGMESNDTVAWSVTANVPGPPLSVGAVAADSQA
ncbi:MAG: fibronectin type III domain-containing protein, partial [Thermoanaerobaculia bacterium]